jgi:hypothetical protein
LFTGLCGFGLARESMDLTRRNPAAILALLVGVAAVAFDGSKHFLPRESVEFELQFQLAADFKAANNFSRAAIHERKTEELKPAR